MRKRAGPDGFGRTPPFALSVFASIICVAFLAVNAAEVRQLSVYGGTAPTLASGGWQLLQACLISGGKVAASLIAAIGSSSLMLMTTARGRAGSRLAGTVFAVLANAPVMMILPLWLVAFGNSDLAGLGFLAYCMTAMLGYVVMNDPEGASLCTRIFDTLPLGGIERWAIAVEVVIASMDAALFQILLLGLPLSLAAELITNRSGLGHIATTAFGNGNFMQLVIVSAAYIVTFTLLWVAWAGAARIVLDRKRMTSGGLQ